MTEDNSDTFAQDIWDSVNETEAAGPGTPMKELSQILGLNPATDFIAVYIPDGDFSGQDMSGFNMSEGNLIGTNWCDADARGCYPKRGRHHRGQFFRNRPEQR